MKLHHKIRFLSIICLALGLSAAVPSEEMPQEHVNPAAAYLPEVVLDEYNLDVNDTNRHTREPKRGGVLRLRTPTDLAELNCLTTTGQPERVVVNHMSDSLVEQDLETLEYFGEMAWHWREGDLIQRKTDEEPTEGRIVEQGDDSVVFVPGAWRKIFNKVDLAEINEEENYVVLKEVWGGGKHEGRLTVLDLTVRVDEGFDGPKADEKLTIPFLDLAQYEFRLGSFTETRPFAKENTLFEFDIRPGITWHDGKPFTGEDVKFSFETIMNSNVECQHLRNYYIDVDKCEVSEDGMTVTYQYNKTYFAAIDFVGGINGQSYFIPRHVFNPEQFGGDERAFAEAFNQHEFKEKPIYTGPYKFKEWRRGDTLTISRNEDYWKNRLPEGSLPKWKKGQPYMDEINLVLYKESAASIKDLMRGVLDADLDVEPSMWAQSETNSPVFLAKVTRARRVGFLYTYIGWNLQRQVFQDENVRRALAMLIPRKEIADAVHEGQAFPVDGPFYVYGPGYDKSVEPITYDPAGAKRLLARAGWLDRDGDGVIEKRLDGESIPFEFSYSIHNAREYHQKIADIVKENVEQAGISVTINKSEWANFMKTVRDKNFDAVRFAWGTTLEPDPFQIWHSSQIENKGDNFVSYKNDRVDELCVLIRETLDPTQRWEYCREAHRLIHEDQPYCFLFGFHENYFISRGIQGVRLYPSQYPHDYSEWYWSKEPEGRE